MSVVLSLLVPGMPQPLLVPEQNPGWAAIRRGFGEARALIEASGANLLVLYSTGWPSVIGHQIQADPAPEWVHVDQDWHMLGSIPYRFSIDVAFAAAWQQAAAARGLPRSAGHRQGVEALRQAVRTAADLPRLGNFGSVHSPRSPLAYSSLTCSPRSDSTNSRASRTTTG